MARLRMVQFYVAMRWVRLTVRRYGAAYLVRKSRPRHAALGRGVARDTGQHGAMTGWNLPSGELVAMLTAERMPRAIGRASVPVRELVNA